MFKQSQTIPEEKETASSSSPPPKPAAAAKAQKITPFDVEAGVDADGNVVGM